MSRGLETTPSTTPRLGYNPALDGVRAFAVLAVMVSHTFTPHTGGGKVGVLIFFVLSGFLITTLLLRERDARGSVSLRNFYMRRALRLFPALVLATVAYAIYAVIHFGPGDPLHTLQAIPSALFYFTNWWAIAGGSTGYVTHYWSLSVEEQFYILWPLLLLAAYRWRGTRAVMWVAAAGAVLSYAEKCLVYGGPVRQLGTDFAADSLLAGCALAAAAVLYRDRVASWGRLLFFPAIVGMVAAYMLGDSTGAAGHEASELFARLWWPIAVLGSCAVIAALHGRTAPGWSVAVLGWRPIAYLGRISYGMYLWHILVLTWLDSHRLPGRAVLLLALVVGTVLVAALSYELVERRFLRMKGRFEPDRRPSATEAAPAISS